LRFVLGIKPSSSAVRADAWHHRSDARLPPRAAGIGIAIALWGGKGYESADDWAALFASGLIAWNGIRLLKPAVDELMDALPSQEMQKEICQHRSELYRRAGR
jgi:divalent metal cation (Fe/Co/Zn/Cd) transporter